MIRLGVGGRDVSGQAYLRPDKRELGSVEIPGVSLGLAGATHPIAGGVIGLDGQELQGVTLMLTGQACPRDLLSGAGGVTVVTKPN